MEWQKRLYEHEQAPEPDQWPALSEKLHPGAGRLAVRLSGMEAVPPEDAWQAIAQAIGNPAPKGKGLLRTIRGFAVPAAAACLAFLALRLFLPATDKDSKPSAAAAIGGVRALQKTPARDPSPPAPEKSATASAASPKTGPGKTLQRVIARSAVQTSGRQDANYLEVCDPKGLFCNRINYKLEGMAECLHARAAVAASEPCSQELREWVDRMEHSSYVPAPGHFFDIVELAASLHGER